MQKSAIEQLYHRAGFRPRRSFTPLDRRRRRCRRRYAMVTETNKPPEEKAAPVEGFSDVESIGGIPDMKAGRPRMSL